MFRDQDFLEDRRRSLEEEFFYQENKKLLDQLRQSKEMEHSKERLSKACGIRDEALLEKLLGLGFQAETAAALGMVPLVEVAWADGHMDQKERQAVLAASETQGLAPGEVEYELLKNWLSHRPEPELLRAWERYIAALCEELSDEESTALKNDLLGHVRAVAQASGGFLGLGSISQAEVEMLERLEKAFP